ncbi:hypothetical protein [Streptomyces sp. NPDC058683]|uniref:hypothetical protein n=1 Tax=Streptomyces sp. NPDC058683 TaxID=3346597 RepID=UPI003662577B
MNAERCTDLAAQMMRSALDSWRGGNRLFAVLHAGMGSEFCLKAILCHHDPLLISAHGDRALRFPTLGFAGEPRNQAVMEARNGIAHLAHHNPATAQHVVATALQVAEAVRKELDTPAPDFWRGYAGAFHDLSKVAAMPAMPRVGLEQAAEDLAQAEAKEAARAAMDAAESTAVTAADVIARLPRGLTPSAATRLQDTP